eukprot:GHVQ01022575.1.p1 GENE.GHVQ01022575.1~~GHVQ01022575.1.p1  ORF type:complete len:578 (+),score=97.09 GHVQ01022575.1:373-2106(+)
MLTPQQAMTAHRTSASPPSLSPPVIYTTPTQLCEAAFVKQTPHHLSPVPLPAAERRRSEVGRDMGGSAVGVGRVGGGGRGGWSEDGGGTGVASLNSLSVVDNRTGTSLSIPIHDDCISSTAFKQLTSPPPLPPPPPHTDVESHEEGISMSRRSSVLRCFDPGYMNTACCVSRICYIDGDRGVLRYRGYAIEELAANQYVSYEEVSFLLLFGNLPTVPQLRKFRADLSEHARLPWSIKELIRSFSPKAHPMGVLMSAVAALGTCRAESNPALAGQDVYMSAPVRVGEVIRMLGVMPTLAASINRHREGLDIKDPSLTTPGFTKTFMELLDRRSDDASTAVHPKLHKAMDILFILHAEHELNCSTAAVRHLASSNADLYTCIAGGVGALYGPRHGGANEAVVKMLEEIGNVNNIPRFLDDVKCRKKKLMGFGHRVYKSYDPRAKLIRKVCDDVFSVVGKEPLIELAVQLEQAAMQDEYFTSRKLYPNVDFYSGIIYRALGFVSDFYPVLFAVGRVAGWLAHWLEFQQDPDNRIVRPFQIYRGHSLRHYTPIERRTQLVGDDQVRMAYSSVDTRRQVSKL